MKDAPSDARFCTGSQSPQYPVGLSKAEAMWIDVIRHASRDGDVLPTLDRVHKVRALFRGFANERRTEE